MGVTIKQNSAGLPSLPVASGGHNSSPLSSLDGPYDAGWRTHQPVDFNFTPTPHSTSIAPPSNVANRNRDSSGPRSR